jgi:hypothetical protein
MHNRGPVSSVGTSTDCGIDVPRIKSRWGKIISDKSKTYLRTIRYWYRVFPGGKAARRGADQIRLLAPRSRMSRAIPLLPVGPSLACYRMKVTF